MTATEFRHVCCDWATRAKNTSVPSRACGRRIIDSRRGRSGARAGAERQPMSFAFCRGRFPRRWLCWSLENCTGSERVRPGHHVLICRFGPGPGEPQPSMAATNKCLAQMNKTRRGPKATNKRPAGRRDFLRARNWRLPPFGGAKPREKPGMRTIKPEKRQKILRAGGEPFSGLSHIIRS